MGNILYRVHQPCTLRLGDYITVICRPSTRYDMSRQSHMLHRLTRQVLRCSLRILPLFAMLIITLAPVTHVNAQSRSPQLRRDRRLTREVTIRYPSSTNGYGRSTHSNRPARTFRPGPSSSTSTRSDEHRGSNDTPNGFRHR